MALKKISRPNRDNRVNKNFNTDDSYNFLCINCINFEITEPMVAFKGGFTIKNVYVNTIGLQTYATKSTTKIYFVMLGPLFKLLGSYRNFFLLL